MQASIPFFGGRERQVEDSQLRPAKKWLVSQKIQ
jgi:hypothetical protein